MTLGARGGSICGPRKSKRGPHTYLGTQIGARDEKTIFELLVKNATLIRSEPIL